MKTIVVLTGAGISAESGIQTFRGSGGLWEGYDIMEVASPIGWKNNPELVLEFYNKRRRDLHKVQPNAAHQALVKLEEKFHVEVITQNVDDLHERAGSKNVLHLHGELRKVRSEDNPAMVLEWEEDLNLGDLAEDGAQLRPHIVWFGEAVPLLENAVQIVSKADILIVVGTSLQVYPAAGLLHEVSSNTPIFYIDPHPSIQSSGNLQVIAEKAGVGLPQLAYRILNTL